MCLFSFQWMGCGLTGVGLGLVPPHVEAELRCGRAPAPTRHRHPGGWIVPGLRVRIKVVGLTPAPQGAQGAPVHQLPQVY